MVPRHCKEPGSFSRGSRPQLLVSVWRSSDAASNSAVLALRYRGTAKTRAASLAATLTAAVHGSCVVLLRHPLRRCFHFRFCQTV
ncbi:hypothetical protein NDU88_007233 [Pleurodeles waltl]|uniref:Uncharacterized protein n=1 Tax=Pleurodeles waltl TaxID=8319 RepID=A0AAV7SRQ7_PLEWA|nr:hypothetical protein NDU88_007233 [Pleurodeles waltl]